MFFMMGIMNRMKELASDQMVICDRCGKYGRYQVYMTYMVLSIFFIPVFKWSKKYYVEMTCCHTSYHLDPEIGRRIERGEDVEIRPQDLTLDYGANGGRAYLPYKRCEACGYSTEDDFEYCPKCGRKF